MARVWVVKSLWLLGLFMGFLAWTKESAKKAGEDGKQALVHPRWEMEKRTASADLSLT